MSNDNDEELDFAEPTALSFSESSVIYVSNEAYDLLMAELEKPPKVNEKLLATLKLSYEWKDEANANALGTHPETS